MTTKHLLEAATMASTEPSADGAWTVRLISEGRGSSGVYTRQLLENYHHVFEDVLSFLNHPTGSVQERNFTEIAGRIKNVRFTVEEDGVGAVYGDYLPDEQYVEKLSKYRDKLGLSIFISGTGSVEESTGDFIVESFEEDDPFASVDVVIAPGARGKFMESMQQVYSARVEEKDSGTRQMNENKETKMDQELKDAFASITALLTPLVTAKEATDAAEAQVKADEAAVTSAVESYDAAIKLIDSADLLPVQVESLRSAAKAGQDVAPLIEAAKAVKAEAIKAVTESAAPAEAHGVVLGETASIVNPWKGR